MPDPGRWLRDRKNYLPENYQLVARFFLAELILACTLAFGFEWILGRRQGATVQSVPIWYRVFRQELPKKKGKKYAPFVGVRLSDGTEYGGLVAGYSTEFHLADRELELSPPLLRRFPGEQSAMPLPDDWQRVVIRGPEIRDLWVAYRPIEPRLPKRRRSIVSYLSAIDLFALLV